MGALVGARTCGRCGGHLGDRATWCHFCGVRNVPAAPGSALGSWAGLLAGVRPAAPGRRRAAAAIDLGLPLLLVGAAVATAVAGTSGGPVASGAVVPVAVAAAVVVLLVDAVLYVVSGRSLGRLLLSLRTVDDLTGRPPAVARVDRRGRFSFRRQTVTVDLRQGRDPLTSSPPPAVRPVVDATATRAPARPAPAAGTLPDETSFGRTGQGSAVLADATAAVLVLDSGERLEVESTLLVGRAPSNPEGEEHALFAWADLERSLTKTHALFERQGGVLWVTDLASTNGSSLVAPDGTRQPLVPGLRGAAGPGYVVELGQRTLTVHASAVVDA